MRYLVSLVLALSGAAAVAADVQRWHLACTGGFDELDCLRMQDHSWDYAIPWDPWTPIGTSAHLMALSYALLAVAALGLAPAVVRAWWAWVVGVPFAAAFAVLAATTYESASAGRVVHLPGTVAALRARADRTAYGSGAPGRTRVPPVALPGLPDQAADDDDRAGQRHPGVLHAPLPVGHPRQRREPSVVP